jgi:hypothetical protein
MTLERDAMILDAASKGATKVAIARAVGLSRQQVHAIVAAGTAPDVAPFDSWATEVAPAAEVAPVTEVAESELAEVWGEVF